MSLALVPVCICFIPSPPIQTEAGTPYEFLKGQGNEDRGESGGGLKMLPNGGIEELFPCPIYESFRKVI